MVLTPWKGMWDTRFPSLRDEMDKLFEDFFGRSGFPVFTGSGWMPPMDILETKKDVVVAIELPGINPKEVSISVMEDRLTVKGEKKQEQELKEEALFRSERSFGAFQRTVQLPGEVVGDKARATYKDGVLTIVLPKSQKAMPKEIRVEVE